MYQFPSLYLFNIDVKTLDLSPLIFERKFNALFLDFSRKGRNCDADLLKKWSFENLWNHFEVYY